MNTIKEKFSQLSKKLHTNNYILSERRDFNNNMATKMIKFEN